MIDGAVPKLVRYLPAVVMLALVVGGTLFGGLKGHGPPKGGIGTPLDGWLGDDGQRHHGPSDHGSDGGGIRDDGGGGCM